MTIFQEPKIQHWPNNEKISDNEIDYICHLFRNRIYGNLISAFAKAHKETGVSRADICKRVNFDRSQITRLLSQPSNLQIDTICKYLLSIGATLDTEVVFERERQPTNYAHPLSDLLDSRAIEGLEEAPDRLDIIDDTPKDHTGTSPQNAWHGTS